MQCDIIIPAYNNPPALPLVLTALQKQFVPTPWKINIITADGGGSPSPAAARNQALRKTGGDVVLFLGADIILRPGALARHLEFHQINPDPSIGALGMVKWHPSLLPTPLMEWMVHGGPQNDFDSVMGQAYADPAHFFYGSHLSLKRNALGDLLFNESFGAYGWEDLEFGRRLARRGFSLVPLADAIGLHSHAYLLPDIRRRQRAAGQALALYQKSHPDIPLLPRRSPARQIARAMVMAAGGQAALHLLLHFTALRFATPKIFQLYTANEFWRGIWKSGFSP